VGENKFNDLHQLHRIQGLTSSPMNRKAPTSPTPTFKVTSATLTTAETENRSLAYSFRPAFRTKTQHSAPGAIMQPIAEVITKYGYRPANNPMPPPTTADKMQPNPKKHPSVSLFAARPSF
jgi:hypothetical protein